MEGIAGEIVIGRPVDVERIAWTVMKRHLEAARDVTAAVRARSGPVVPHAGVHEPDTNGPGAYE
jgi:hypothetical protein